MILFFLLAVAIYLYITPKGTAIMHELTGNHRDQMNLKKVKWEYSIACCYCNSV